MKNFISQYAGLRKEIYILFAGKLVTAMGSFVWPMLTFFLTTKLGLSDGISTLVIAISSTLSFPAALLGGKLADQYSRKKIIILFDSLTVSLYVLAAILPIGFHSGVLILFAGLFQTIESPAYDALNADFSTTEQREKAFSLSYLGCNLGFIVGAGVSGILFENYTNLAFLINGLAILVSTVLILLFVDMKNAVGESEEQIEALSEYEKPVEDERTVLDVLKSRKVVAWMILISCVASMPSSLVGVLLPLQLKESMGQAGAALYGYLSSLNGLTVILLTPLLTRTLRRFTEIPKSICGMLLFCSGMVLFALGAPQIILYVGMFIYTAGEVVTVLGSNPYASRRIPASHRGRIGGITSVVFSLFSSFTQFVISAILLAAGSNYPLLWGVFISVGAVACVMYAFVYKLDKKTFPLLYKGEGEGIIL